MKKYVIFILGAMLLFITGLAHASVISFDNRVSFNAAIDSGLFKDKTVEGWDTYPDLTTFSSGSSVNGITYHSDVLVTDKYFAPSAPNGLGQSPYHYFPAGDTIEFSFNNPIVAFGISFSTWSKDGEDYWIKTNSDDDTVFASLDPFPGHNFGQFAGLISDSAISSVIIGSEKGAFGFNLDDMTYAAASDSDSGPGPTSHTPIPPTVFLLGSGIFGLMVIRIRKVLR